MPWSCRKWAMCSLVESVSISKVSCILEQLNYVYKALMFLRVHLFPSSAIACEIITLAKQDLIIQDNISLSGLNKFHPTEDLWYKQ